MGKGRRRIGPTIKGVLFILFLLWIPIGYSQHILKIPLYIHQKEIWVEAATTPEERSRGINGEKPFGERSGDALYL